MLLPTLGPVSYTHLDVYKRQRLPGLGETGARYFRDKLAMRTQASAAGIPVPPFTPVFSYDRLRDYMARVPPPWVRCV